MDRGALWSTLHGAGKSQTRLKWLSTCVHTHTKIKETDVWHVARLPEWIHYFLLDPELSSRTTIFLRPNCPGSPAFSCIYAITITTTLFLHTHAITRSSMRESVSWVKSACLKYPYRISQGILRNTLYCHMRDESKISYTYVYIYNWLSLLYRKKL